MSDVFGSHELRIATIEVSQWLYDAARIGLIPSDDLEVPTVASQFEGQPVHPKCERYALGAALGGLVAYHAISGDGPEARFTEFVQAPQAVRTTTDDPYRQFEFDLKATFTAAEGALDSSGLAAAARYFDCQYRQVMQYDPSTRSTKLPVGPERIGTNSEGPYEAAMLVQQTAIAIGKTQENGPLRYPELTVARMVTNMSMSRAGLPVTDFRAHPPRHYDDMDPAQCPIDLDKGSLLLRGSRYVLDMGGQTHVLPAGHHWLKDHPRIGPTLKCILRLVRIEPGHENSALQNFLYASVNQAYDQGLYDPVLASKWWEVRKAETT